MKKMGTKARVWLFATAVLLSSAGAGLVTKAALSPYTRSAFTFAVFCWFVVAVILVMSIYFTKTIPSSKTMDDEAKNKG